MCVGQRKDTLSPIGRSIRKWYIYDRHLISLCFKSSKSLTASKDHSQPHLIRLQRELQNDTSLVTMKITALVALGATFLPAALGADFALYYSTHDASWEDQTGSDRLLGNTNLFPGKHTEVPAGGVPTDAELNDGQGNRLKTLGGVPFTKSYREHSWLITTGSTTINVSVGLVYKNSSYNRG